MKEVENKVPALTGVRLTQREVPSIHLINEIINTALKLKGRTSHQQLEEEYAQGPHIHRSGQGHGFSLVADEPLGWQVLTCTAKGGVNGVQAAY